MHTWVNSLMIYNDNRLKNSINRYPNFINKQMDDSKSLYTINLDELFLFNY